MKIPDTIIMQQGQPSQWFFTSSTYIKQKRKRGVTTAEILKNFLKKVFSIKKTKKGEPVALLFEIIPGNDTTGQIIQGPCNYKQSFVKNEDLEQTLARLRREGQFRGLLQKYITPNESHDRKFCFIRFVPSKMGRKRNLS